MGLTRGSWTFVLAAVAAIGGGCGGGGGSGGSDNTFTPQPSPDCSPPTSPTVSAAAAVAGPATDPGVCVEQVASSSLPSARVIHLGQLPVNTRVAFDVPDKTGSFTIVLQKVTASTGDVTFAGTQAFRNTPVPLKITAPDGSAFYDDTSVPLDFTKANAVHFPGQSGTGAFTVPNTSHTLSAWQRGVPTGHWTFVVGDYAAECADLGPSGCTSGADTSGVYDVTVLLRPGPLPTTGTIDVSFYLASTTYQASTAGTDPGLARMVATFNSIFANAGICLNKVTFVDVPAWARTKYAAGVDVSRTGPCDDLSQLFTLSQPDSDIHIFLVDDILQNGGGGLLTVGIDGAIPGPSSIGGTIVSGAVVNDANVEHGVGTSACGATPDFSACGPDRTALVVAHETGHWLGLYHTTERNGGVFDPVSDTGTCPCAQCAPQQNLAACSTPLALVTQTDCSKGASCSGANNLMFWEVGSEATLSPQQAQIMRGNPAVR